MTNSFIGKRVVFLCGKQRSFVETIEKKIPTAEMAQLCLCSERTIRDWRREKFHMPLMAVRVLCYETKTPLPKHIRIQDEYAHTARAGKIGHAAVVKKNGKLPIDESARKKAWEHWWKTKGAFKKIPILEPKSARVPIKSIELAECVGILIGDGGISAYQVVVSLNHITDKEYSVFVSQLMSRLFRVSPQVYHHPKKGTMDVTISRRNLVRYLHTLGLPIGNKIRQSLDMPAWIKKDRAFSIACIRGMVDTDGCIVLHRYSVNGKQYTYKKLEFASASPPLIRSVHTALMRLELQPRISKDGRHLWLDSIADVKRYFSIIGTHNPKHLRRYVS